jgi:hypothetical protein
MLGVGSGEWSFAASKWYFGRARALLGGPGHKLVDELAEHGGLRADLGQV